MHRTHLRPWGRVRAALVAFAVMVTTVLAVPAIGQEGPLSVPDDAIDSITSDKVEGTYIVLMEDDPVIAYDGGVAGLAATEPSRGEKVDPDSSRVRAYQSHLEGRQDAALADVGVDPSAKRYEYTIAVSGFAAVMTGSEALALSKQANVLAVVEDQLNQPDTISTPDFLGLTARGGAWAQGIVGEDVVVGIIDTGIWPENPSFADTGYDPLSDWSGACETGDEFTVDDCNDKLIGARFYASGFGDEEVTTTFPFEYYSPRDADGHGSHTASTAAGNSDVEVVVDGDTLGTASGIAPRARIAAYKVCWGRLDGGCFTSDSMAAIDQAVADGVDVLNFSISGTSTNFLDPVEVAFLFAADAGVVVNASAGNAGPSAGTVAHPSPWITTVAAGTHDRASFADVILGDGSSYNGASIQTTGTDVLPLVYSADVGLEGADPEEVVLCFPGTLDPDLVAGKMVLCDRGVNARVDKSLAVQQAGGLAMILANVTPSSINADLHFVPTVHVDEVARAAILAYIEGAGDAATGQLTPGVRTVDRSAPQVAAFSSRGPLLASSDLLKPDIMAPGQDVIAAVSPDNYHGRNWDSLSGTSMSSPHMAGMSALMKQAHPDWSPAAIKSALMTSADPVRQATPFDVGSGHVDINTALDQTLVYDAGFNDYVAFLCGTGQLTGCDDIAIDPSDLNQPNITVGELAGVQRVTRTVTNVGDAGTFRVSVKAPPGVSVRVSPNRLNLGAGESGTYTVQFTTQEAAPLGDYTFGSLEWIDRHNQRVRSQLVVRPVELAVPDEVSGEGVEGSGSFDIGFGYTGDYVADDHGLEPALITEGNVVDDPANDINVALATGVGITIHEIPIAAGSAHARFSLFDDYTDGEDDLDLYVFDSDGNFIGGSGGGTSEEQVDVPFPADTTYLVVVHGWQTDGPDANYSLFSWNVLSDPDAGSDTLSVDSAPASATLGEEGTVEYSWSGLDAGTKYLGAVSHSDGTDLLALTLVSVATD